MWHHHTTTILTLWRIISKAKGVFIILVDDIHLIYNLFIIKIILLISVFFIFIFNILNTGTEDLPALWPANGSLGEESGANGE